jgi:hypothetical protein
MSVRGMTTMVKLQKESLFISLKGLGTKINLLIGGKPPVVK